MWSDGANIHRILSDKKLRDAHIRNIVNLVNENDFDGIDIDYEAKLADTNPYFSTFLRDLQKSLGSKKWLMCTVEPRTPVEDRNVAPGSVPRYANDYEELNRHCDRVRIMAYDQASVDKKLTLSTDLPYIPVADVRWVEKVMKEAMETISADKLMLGIATYGYEYEAIPLSHGYRYNRLWAFNQRYATELAQEIGVVPMRNIAGELSFIYRPDATSTAPVATVFGTYSTASSFLSFAGASFHILWWSDADAIRQKVELARRLGVRGVSIFKIDGGADQGIWNFLPAYSNR
jgi:spore germination protein